MTPTETLKHEHEIVLLILDAAEREAASIRTTGTAHVAEVEEMVDFFKNFVDRCHHGKEERHLFPTMESRGLPSGGGPLAVMLHEHEQGRAAVRAIGEALVRIQGGNRDAAPQLADALLQYAEVLRGHIFKENNVLFRMAERVMSETDDADVTSRFSQVEQERGLTGWNESFANELAGWEQAFKGG